MNPCGLLVQGFERQQQFLWHESSVQAMSGSIFVPLSSKSVLCGFDEKN
jgi:hypothetical protein